MALDFVLAPPHRSFVECWWGGVALLVQPLYAMPPIQLNRSIEIMESVSLFIPNMTDGRKRFTGVTWLLGLLFSAGVVGITGCKEGGLPKAVEKVHNGVTVSVDPRVELISIVQTLSEYPQRLPFLMTEEHFPYRADVEGHFTRFRRHAVIKVFDELSSRRLSFSGPPESMLYLGGTLAIKSELLLDSLLMGRYEGQDGFRNFLPLLLDFARESNFAQFYNEHRNYYERIVDSVVSRMGIWNYVAELEAFFGKKQASYNIVLVSLYGPVGFGPRLRTARGEQHIYSILGPKTVQDNTPMFGNEEYFNVMLRHEFSHSFVNPLTEAHRDQVLRYSDRFDRLPEVAREKACGDWEECTNEHIVRTVTTYLAFQESQEAGERALAHETKQGMIFVSSLVDRLKEYTNDRKRYPTLDSFYERLIEVFAENP